MMIGAEPTTRHFPTVQIPSWDPYDDPTALMPSTSPFAVSFSGNASGGGDYSSSLVDSFAALHRYLPSNEFAGAEFESPCDDPDMPPVDAFSCDQFRMFEFKIRRCVRGRSHDWTECPYAHPGEKARRRDPRKFHYSGTACPEFRKVGGCQRGESCEFAHGVFECWLHPARYRTQPCKDGPECRRRVCFFAHTPEQLRVLPQQSPRDHVSCESEYGSPIRHSFDSYLTNGSMLTSPTSILSSSPISPPSDSPPNSPQLGCGSFNSVSELVTSMRNLQVAKVKMGPHSSWGSQSQHLAGSPRGSMLRPGFCSMPSTPTRPTTMSGLWEQSCCEEEPAMERVESGRILRAKLYARLSKENSLDRDESVGAGSGMGPDVGWISELVN